MGERVAAHNPEDMLAEVHVNTNVKVFPGEVITTTECLGDFLSVEEHALWDPTVFDLWFSDEDGPVVEIEVDYALADAVVFIRVLHDRFLEVPSETQNCSIIF